MITSSEAGDLSNRIKPMEEIYNFRDYGGYPTRSGGTVRRNLLFRCGELSHATDADQALISSLGIATVIDLRSNYERERAPTALGPGFNGRIAFAAEYVEARAPHVRAADSAADAATVQMRLRSAFAKIPFQPVMIAVFRMYFETLAAGAGMSAGASLVHCSAGKDRTGIAAALLLASLDVHPDDIREDFLLTNRALGHSGRAAAMADVIRRSLGEGASDEAVLATLSVEGDYIDAMFQAIEDRGGLDTYLHETLGLARGTVDRLRETLVQ